MCELPAGEGKTATLPLTEEFEYEVLAVHGQATGRCVVLQRDEHMMIAFRGVRAHDDPTAVGPRLDRAHLAHPEPVPASALGLPERRVHAGVLKHHESVWELGLRAFLAALEKRRAHADQHTPPTTPRQLFFVGHCFGQQE
jgi:hypothetical protein